jgi:hypothetical protein
MHRMSISLDTLKEAIAIKEQIAALEAKLDKILDGDEEPPSPSKPAKKARGKMSAAAKAKIGAATKARWVNIKGTSFVAKPSKKKRKLSAEGRARIIAGQKKRWALNNK